MRKFILLLVTLVLAGFSASAQIATQSDFHYRGGNFYQNGVKLTPEQLYTIIGSESFDKMYKPGNGMRIAGITLLTVGCVTDVVGAGITIGYIVDATKHGDNPGVVASDSVIAAVGLATSITGASMIIAGAVLYGVGNNKLKKITPAKSGTGLAFAF